MANGRFEANLIASFRSDASPDFHLYRYYYYFDNNTLPIIKPFRSAPMRSEAFSDEFLRQNYGNVWFIISQQVAGQLLITIVLIVAVTVCEARIRTLPSFVPLKSCTIRSGAIHSIVTNLKEISMCSRRNKAINNSRWSALFLDQFIYNQQLDVVVVQCNQHHREKRRRSSTVFSTLHDTVAYSYTYLLDVVDSNFTVGIVRIVSNKKILAECIIFAYLISLDLYS